MSKEKIEELAEDIFLYCRAGLLEDDAKKIAEFVIDKRGYRKQSEGEWKQVCGDLGWVEMECSVCKYSDVFDDHKEFHKYCPNCGAKMKGAQE